MALYEYCDVATTSSERCYSTTICGQGFTIGTVGTNVNHTISEVRLHLKKVGSPTGNVVCKIVNDNSNAPGSTTYSSGSVVASTISTSESTVSFSMSSYELQASTKYWITVTAEDGDYSNCVEMFYGSDIYGGTSNCFRAWGSNYGGNDGWFEIYGDTVGNSVVFSSSTTDVSIPTFPNMIIRGITKSIQTYTFASGDEEILDMDKTSDRLTLSFNITSNAYNIVKNLNDMMDSQDVVEVSGLENDDLNTFYHISALTSNQDMAYDDKYDVSITLERKYDEVA